MRLSLLAFFLLLPVSALAGHDPPAALADQTLRALAAARDELRTLDALVDSAHERAVQNELHRKAERIDQILEDVRRLTASLADLATKQPVETVVVVENRPGPAVVFVDPGPVACSSGDLAQIRSAIDGEAFSSGKLMILQNAVNGRYFTADQVTSMIGAFTFGRDQVEAGATMFPHVIDPENWYRVYAAFTFESDKEALRKRVGR